MITKQMAAALPLGKTLYHAKLKNADGTAKRCRVKGRCKTWVTRPNEFRLPVKHGMFDSFYITESNMHEWATTEKMAA